MRKFLLILVILGIFALLSWLNSKTLQKKFPLLKRIDYTITIIAWALLLVSGFALLYWLYTQVFK